MRGINRCGDVVGGEWKNGVSALEGPDHSAVRGREDGGGGAETTRGCGMVRSVAVVGIT